MPHKKKEKLTLDIGTDPPEPLDFDPFDLDGLAIVNDFKPITAKVREAAAELGKQNTTGPSKIKDKVIQSLEIAITWMEQFTRTLEKSRTVAHRLQSIEREILEIKTETKNLPTILQLKAATVKPVQT
jgi:hypothetical protein